MVAGVEEVRFVFEDQLIARHRRDWGKERFSFNPIHYLALLERKPGGFDYARPLEDWQLPDCFDVLRRRLQAKLKGSGLREFIKVLRLLEQCELAELTDAVHEALRLGTPDADSVRLILEHRREQPVTLFQLDGRPHLQWVQVDVPDLSVYQPLLAGG